MRSAAIVFIALILQGCATPANVHTLSSDDLCNQYVAPLNPNRGAEFIKQELARRGIPGCRVYGGIVPIPPSQATSADGTVSAGAGAATISTDRKDKLAQFDQELAEKLAIVRSGKMTYVELARYYDQRFYEIFPELRADPYVNEFTTYQTFLGEQVDKGLLSEAEADYRRSQKLVELTERKNQLYEKQRAEQRVAEQRLAYSEAQRQAMEQQQRQQSGQAMMGLGLQILQWNHERAMNAYQNRPQVCTWIRTSMGWTQSCQ